MSEGRIDTARRNVPWLILGVLVGVAGTGALGVVAMSLMRGSSLAEAGGIPGFESAVDTAGIHHVYDGEFQFFVGGGTAVFDCNRDRLPEVYVAGGTEPAGLFRNDTEPGGSLSFVPVAGGDLDVTDVTGAYPIDVDSDGLVDLAILRFGENLMMRGIGDCRFEPANELWGIDGGDDWTVAFSARWEAEDPLPTLAFGNYLSIGQDEIDRRQCEDHYLFRPDGDRFGTPETLTPGYCTLSILFSDWNRSGTADLRMTNDRHYYTDGEEQLWAMGETPPAQYTGEGGWQHLEIWGMGIASRDLDGDGLPEVFLTSQGDNKLQRLAGGPDLPDYEDFALVAGVTAHRPFIGDTLRPSTAWHADFEDVNNDGIVDLFVSKGNVEAQEDFADLDPNNLFLGQPDGTFEEVADIAGVLDYSRSRGAAVVDLNLDGFLDLVVVERHEPMKIWQGTGRTIEGEGLGGWLMIDLEQAGPNRDGIGGWIEVKTDEVSSSREITIGGGHASGELGWTHFGLGQADHAEVRVIWPDGTASSWETLDANQAVIWDREGGPTPWDTGETR